MIARVSLMPRVGLFTLLLAPVLALCLLYDPYVFSRDAAQYMSVARNLLEGNGPSTSIVYYEEHYKTGRIPAPQTIFPPGYPAGIAALAGAGLPVHLSAYVVCLASLSLGTLLVVLVLRGAGHAWNLALVAGLFWAGSMEVWRVCRVCNSDVPFAAAGAATLYAVQRIEPRGGRWALLAGLAAAVAFSIRYAGLFLVLSLACVLVWHAARTKTMRSVQEAALALLPPATAMALSFGWNYAVVGDPKGGNAYQVLRPATDVARTFAWAVIDLVGFSPGRLARLHLREVVGVLFLAALVGLALASRPRLVRSPRARVRLDVALCLAYPLVSLILLWHLERSRVLGVAGRMLLPLVPFVLLLAAEVVGRIRWATPRLDRRLAMAALAALYLLGQSNLAPARGVGDIAAKNRDIHRALQASGQARQVLEADRASGCPILSSEPQFVGGLLEQRIIGLTSPEFSARRWTKGETEQLVRRFGVCHVLFLPGVGRVDSPGELFDDLSAGRAPVWLTAVVDTSHLRLFEVSALTLAGRR